MSGFFVIKRDACIKYIEKIDLNGFKFFYELLALSKGKLKVIEIMKNPPKNKKHNKNNSKYNLYSKNTNSSKKNNRFSLSSSKNQGVNYLNESDKNKVNFTYSKRTKPLNRAGLKISSKSIPPMLLFPMF